MAVDRAAVALTVHEILGHPAVVNPQGPFFSDDSARFEFELDLGFGARWVAEGASPSGVLPREPVRLDFSSAFPRSAPQPSLRADFSRDQPHLQPYPGSEGRPVPCLVEGSLVEFFAAQGAYRVIDQWVIWLRKAAEDRLIDPEQGWEPMRRDTASDDLICDPDQLRGLVTPGGGFKIMELSYVWRRPAPQKDGFFIGQLWGETNAKAPLGQQRVSPKSEFFRGAGLAFVIWAGHDPTTGGPAVSKEYAPDGVRDLNGLIALATRLRMGEALRAVLTLIARFKFTPGQTVPIPIVLAIRRPCRLIGANSDIELCPYLAPAERVGLGIGNPAVSPLSVHDQITPALLGRLSDASTGQPWALLGCGSLGSKIALHRARDGAGPMICGDKDRMLPHNAARHGLYPNSTSPTGWIGAKADLLAETVTGLGQSLLAVNGDQRDLVTGLTKVDPVTWLLNTTASIVVREDLSGDLAKDIPRVAEACLFDHGAMGYFAVEGADHNPDGVELMGELHAAARSDPKIAAHLFPKDDQLAPITIGQGCGSLTMKVSDAKISVLAGVMAETLAELSPDKADGRIDLWMRDGLGLSHRQLAARAWTRLPLEGLECWTLSLAPRALAAIEADVAQHRKVETGGVLLGFHSLVARRIYVTDVLPAPRDSVRRPHEFVLGVKGLADARRRLAEDTRGALTFAGTWHSHLGAATPSDLDRRSAATVGDGELQPKAFLIRGANGLRAISAATIAAHGFKETVASWSK